MSDTDNLRRLLAARSVKRGDFTLASGKKSSIYVDARLTTMSPEGLVLIGKTGLARIREEGWDPDCVGGLTLGADPVAYAISYASANSQKPLRAFTVRKEPKAHGTGRRLEGPFEAGDTVVVIEDVITTGNSALQAIEAVVREGGRVIGVLSVVDREEGGRQAIIDSGYAVVSLAKISEITGDSSAPGFDAS